MGNNFIIGTYIFLVFFMLFMYGVVSPTLRTYYDYISMPYGIPDYRITVPETTPKELKGTENGLYFGSHQDASMEYRGFYIDVKGKKVYDNSEEYKQLKQELESIGFFAWLFGKRVDWK